MILEPINDKPCLRQVEAQARAWSKTALVRREALKYSTTADLIAAVQQLPQLDDPGNAHAHTLQCDYRVRLRENPRNPNCVERAAWYLAVAEAIDPTTERTLVTVNVTAAGGDSVRHTNVLERPPATAVGAHEWFAVSLFPSPAIGPRNVSLGDVLGDVKDVVHPVGKAVLGFYLGDTGRSWGDALGSYEDQGVAAAGGSRPEASADVRTGNEAAPKTTASAATPPAGKTAASVAAPAAAKAAPPARRRKAHRSK